MSTMKKRQRPTSMCLSFFFDKARRFVIHFYEGFSWLRINFPTRLCRFRQAFVGPDKRLLFPTSICRFRQAFVVSDKRLSFPSSVCCFWQALVVSDKALSFSDKRFVGKSRATKQYNSHDGIPHSCPGVNAAKWPDIRFTGTHIGGPNTWYRSHTDIHQR
jgi:hypothetical protein